MEVDYRQLCRECFGTDDEVELRKLAEELKQSRTLKVGRKPKFSDVDIDQMRKMRCSGKRMDEIAVTFHTSRQIVSKYLNSKPEPGYTLRMTLMDQRRPCTVIDVNFLEQKIKIRNWTDDLLHRAFGCIEEPSWADFEDFLRDRCFPETRGNAKQLLKDMGLPGYDPLAIVEKTKGRMAEDRLWLRFEYFDRNGRAQNRQ